MKKTTTTTPPLVRAKARPSASAAAHKAKVAAPTRQPTMRLNPHNVRQQGEALIQDIRNDTENAIIERIKEIEALGAKRLSLCTTSIDAEATHRLIAEEIAQARRNGVELINARAESEREKEDALQPKFEEILVASTHLSELIKTGFNYRTLERYMKKRHLPVDIQRIQALVEERFGKQRSAKIS